MLNDDQRAEFEAMARPLIKFLNDNCHPHVSIHIENDHAELSEGVAVFRTEEYWPSRHERTPSGYRTVTAHLIESGDGVADCPGAGDGEPNCRAHFDATGRLVHIAVR